MHKYVEQQIHVSLPLQSIVYKILLTHRMALRKELHIDRTARAPA